MTAAFAAGLLLLTGCGSGTDSTSGSASGSGSTASVAADHNAADTTFAQQMIPHHQQAVEMADIVIDKGSDVRVENLARQIKAAQQPEIEEMTGWLKTWGQPIVVEGHGGMSGMMTADDMKRLSAASGSALDRMFLEMMIKHHEGAVAAANTELRAGENPEAKQLAERIKRTQTAEIATMRQLLGSATPGS